MKDKTLTKGGGSLLIKSYRYKADCLCQREYSRIVLQRILKDEMSSKRETSSTVWDLH